MPSASMVTGRVAFPTLRRSRSEGVGWVAAVRRRPCAAHSSDSLVERRGPRSSATQAYNFVP